MKTTISLILVLSATLCMGQVDTTKKYPISHINSHLGHIGYTFPKQADTAWFYIIVSDRGFYQMSTISPYQEGAKLLFMQTCVGGAYNHNREGYIWSFYEKQGFYCKKIYFKTNAK